MSERKLEKCVPPILQDQFKVPCACEHNFMPPSQTDFNHLSPKLWSCKDLRHSSHQAMCFATSVCMYAWHGKSWNVSI